MTDRNALQNTRIVVDISFGCLLAITLLAGGALAQRHMPTSGLDLGWVLGTVQAVAQHLIFGRDLIFNFGPYSAIYTKAFSPATDVIIFWSEVGLNLAYALALFLNFRNSAWQLKAALILLVASLSNPEPVLTVYPLAVCTFALMSAQREQRLTRAALLAFIGFPLGLLPLIKGTALLSCAVMITPAVLILIWRRRIAEASVLTIAPATGLLLFWIAIGQPLGGLPDYIANMSEIIRGYSEGMSLPGPILSIVTYALSCAYFLHRLLTTAPRYSPGRLARTLLFSWAFFIAFKVGFVRHDGHALIAASVLLFGAVLALALLERNFNRYDLAAMALTVIGIVGMDPKLLTAFVRNPAQLYAAMIRSLDPRMSGYQPKRYQQALALIRSERSLPVLPGTSDIYSYGQSDLIASGNSWSPRPIFQSYQANTPVLAEINRRHLTGDQAPNNVFFSVQPIDNRLPSLEDGASWPELLLNYHLSEQLNDLLVLKRNSQQTNSADYINLISEQTADIGKSLAVPPCDQPIFARMEVRKNLIGEVLNILFKPSVLEIHLTLQDGTVISRRFLSGLAGAGFVLSPYVSDTKDFAGLYSGANTHGPKAVTSFEIVQTGYLPEWQREYRIRWERFDLGPGTTRDCSS